MTLGNILLAIFILMLLGARPARRKTWSQQDLYWYNVCLANEQMGNKQQEKGNMNILEHTYQGATIKLDQRELLLVMALVQEGRESFGCNTESGRALDELFSTANLLVEEARRRTLQQPVVRKTIHLITAPVASQGSATAHR